MEELLSRIPFFSNLPRGELKYLAHALTVEEIAAGHVLFRQGETGDTLYIVIEGSLDVLMGEGTDEEKFFSTLGPGAYVGEMSLLMPGGKRSASVRAALPTRMWVMTREDFDDLLHRQPHLAYSMVKVLSERLDASNTATFRDIVAKNRELQTAYDELKAAHLQLVEKEKLEKEMQLAAGIQNSILPNELPALPGFDFGAHMDPARAVGGDFYDVFLLDEYRAGVLIGDVADKGAPSAIFMARVHALITAEALRCDGPGEVLRCVNQYLLRRSEDSLFVTAVYGVLDSRTGTFHFARAGHDVPLLFVPGSPLESLPFHSGQPIGLLESMTLDEHIVQIAPGGTLLLFSDGMTDCRNPQGDAFGRERLFDAFGQLGGLGGQQVCDALIQQLLDFRQDAAQDDDVTLVAIHNNSR